MHACHTCVKGFRYIPKAENKEDLLDTFSDGDPVL